jgi:hypothetical protein
MISAEEKGFEPLEPLRVRRFSNSNPMRAGSSTELHVPEGEALGTTRAALERIELHADHGLDHGGDHGTTTVGPQLEALTTAVLEGIAKGDPEAVVLADRMSAALLDVPLVRRALTLHELLRDRSPFALVRAVELARDLLALDVIGVHSAPTETRRF